MPQYIFNKFFSLITIFFFFSSALTTLTGKVIGISDGDTITILTPEKKQIKIRLNGVDCPEKDQAFGQKAKQFTSDLVFGKTVSVQIVDTDRYGRSIGIITLPDGRKLNQELVKEGFAWWYRQYSPKDTTLQRWKLKPGKAKKGFGLIRIQLHPGIGEEGRR